MSYSVHSRSVDVSVVDTPRAAAAAFGVPRTDAESTHVLCRHADETPRDFGERVLRRIKRMQLSHRVRSLRYVVGPDVVAAEGALPLLGALLPLLDAGASLTVVGPGSRQSDLFEGIDSVLQRHGHDLTVRAQLYADGERAVPRSGVRRTHAGSAPAPSSSRGRLGWFPVDTAGHHAPDSARAYAAS